MERFTVYRIRNKATGRCYIGGTANYRHRVTRHFSNLRCGRAENPWMQEEFDVYGAEHFVAEILGTTDTEKECRLLEQQHISNTEGTYNRRHVREEPTHDTGTPEWMEEMRCFISKMREARM